MSKQQKKDTRTISIIVNAVIVIWTVYCMWDVIVHGLEGNMTGKDWTVFRYYTMDSNIFAAVTAAIMLISRIVKGQPQSFATNMKFYGTCTVTVTLLTVVAFLGPTIGYKKMFEGDNLYLHLIGPLLAIISFCYLDKGPKMRFVHVGKSLVPTIIYAAVYALEVLVLKNWKDFYGFNRKGQWYISAAAMLVGAFVVAVIVKALHNDK